jgi:hypothetical protein
MNVRGWNPCEVASRPNYSQSMQRRAQAWGLSLGVVCCAVGIGASSVAWSAAYPPDGPDFPTVTLNEGTQGAAGLPPLNVPPPNGWDQESIWNMQKLGFNDNQGRASSDDGWAENQNGRYILYVTNNGSDTPTHHFNPLTNQTEKDGTSLIDVTDPTKPVFVYHIPSATGSSTHLKVCGGSTLPNAAANGLTNRFFLLRADGNSLWEIWDTTDPSKPEFVTQVIGNGVATHHGWWECDTGIAYMVFQSATDGWHTNQHVYIYDLSNPASPVFIRQWGVPGQQPTSTATQSCNNTPSNNCYEGVVNPPTGVHEMYSAGVAKNRVYFGYGSSSNGIDQIVDRDKLLNGCNPAYNPAASPTCANSPTQADLLFPQVSYITMNPLDGGHTFQPMFGVPIPQEQSNFLTGAPVKLDLAINMSEQTANDCAPQKWKNPSIIDISNDKAPWPISTATVGQFPGDFCAKGARFGTHEISREIYAPYYGRLLIASFFNAGLQVFDIRDPYNPRRVAYFIQAPNANTQTTCGTFQGQPNCRAATFSDLGELDDRGYVYNLDRAGSGVTVLQFTGDAVKVVTGQGNEKGK